MSELELLSRRQDLLEQAARLQRATISVRLYKIETHKGAMLMQTAVDLYRRFLKSPTSVAVTMGAARWLINRFRKH